MKTAVEGLGNWISQAAYGAGYALVLMIRAMAWFRSAFRRRALNDICQQMHVCGIASLPVTLVVSVFTGAILALNGLIALEDLGQERLIGGVVVVSMAREMGPFMTALILAASVGSSMAAELGTMKVSEEIDALEVMGIDPAKFLVMPRVVAMIFMCPVLTIYSSLLGSLGGATTAYFQFGVTFAQFQSEGFDHLVVKDVYTGLLKAVIFGLVIAVVGCSQGLRASGGAIGVGRATRRSVVTSFLLIIIIGYYITFLFYGLGD